MIRSMIKRDRVYNCKRIEEKDLIKEDRIWDVSKYKVSCCMNLKQEPIYSRQLYIISNPLCFYDRYSKDEYIRKYISIMFRDYEYHDEDLSGSLENVHVLPNVLVNEYKGGGYYELYDIFDKLSKTYPPLFNFETYFTKGVFNEFIFDKEITLNRFPELKLNCNRISRWTDKFNIKLNYRLSV